MSGTGVHGGGPAQDTGGAPLRPGLAPLVFSISKLRLMGVALLCVPFVLVGIFLVHESPDWNSGVMGWVCILFFGGGGLWFLWKKLREPRILTLSEEGLKPESGGFILWEDFDAAGVGRIHGAPGGTKVIGIRLKSYERFVKSLTPEEIRLMRGANAAARFSAGALPRVAGRSGRRMRRSLDHLRSMPRQDAGSLPLQDVAGSLGWSRGLCGWDVTFSPMLFNRRSDKVVREIEDYHRAVLKLRSGS